MPGQSQPLRRLVLDRRAQNGCIFDLCASPKWKSPRIVFRNSTKGHRAGARWDAQIGVEGTAWGLKCSEGAVTGASLRSAAPADTHMRWKRAVPLLVVALAVLLVLAAQGPEVQPQGVVNGASFLPRAPVAPGSIASVFGTGLSSLSQSAATKPLPTSLGTATLRFNSSLPVPMFAVSPGQINFQVPWELAGQTQALLTVTEGGVTSPPETVRLAAFAPGIFTIGQAGCQGAVLGASSGVLAAPTGRIPGRISRPVLPGEFITIFGTGLGPVTDQPRSGEAASSSRLSSTTLLPEVSIGSIPARVTFSGLAPDFVGLYQVNAQVPANVPLGSAVPIVLSVGPARSNIATIAVGSGEGTCTPCGSLPAALLACRNWITFAPPRPFNPDLGAFPTEAELRASLAPLYAEGWRGLVTFSLDGSLSQVPRIAKEVGFTMVIAGLFWFDDAQLARERTAALEQLSWIDGFVLGNEGLQFRRYTRASLQAQMAGLRAATGLAVTTCETLSQYLLDPSLLTLGDWVCLNTHPWLANIRTIPEAVEYVQRWYRAFQTAAPGRAVVVNETWWPTGGGDFTASEASQVEFFRRLAGTEVRFVWGEAFDQYWKMAEGPQGPFWGYHTDNAIPKRIIRDLQTAYTSAYPF